MQCIVLAAGRGMRMGSLTDALPKPLLTIAGKTLLDYKLEILPPAVDEIIIVTGYLGHLIQERFGDSYQGKRVHYVEQSNPIGGTADALWCARELLHDRFITMMGDDIYCASDVEACIQAPGWSLLVSPVHGRRSGGMIVSDNVGRIVRIDEGEHDGEWYMCTNLFVLDTRVFESAPVAKGEGSRELGLPQTVLVASAQSGVPIMAIPASRWVQITDHQDLLDAEVSLGA